MTPEIKDWKVTAFKRLDSAIPWSEEEDAELDAILDSDSPGKRSLLHHFQLLNPKIDLASLSNGISASQLGALVGQLQVTVNMFDGIEAFLSVKSADLESSRKATETELAKLEGMDLDSDAREFTEQVRELVNGVAVLNLIPEEFAELRGVKESLDGAISACLALARKQVGAEPKMFFASYANALGSPSLDSKGQIISGNEKTTKIHSILLLLLLADDGLDPISSVTELHRVLAVMIPDELTRDEESLEWVEEHKRVEGVCRTLGITFRGRGRPKNKKPKS